MRRLSTLLLLLFCGISANAQTSSTSEIQPEPQKEVKAPAGNNIAYLEIGGVCAYYSANFQHNFRLSERFDLAAGISLSLVPFSARKVFDYSPRLGFQSQAIYKMGQHEIGLGAVLCFYTYHYPELDYRGKHYQELRGVLGAQLGYSYSTKKHLYFGAYLTPYFLDCDDIRLNSNDVDFTFFGGVRIGYRFR